VIRQGDSLSPTRLKERHRKRALDMERLLKDIEQQEHESEFKGVTLPGEDDTSIPELPIVYTNELNCRSFYHLNTHPSETSKRFDHTALQPWASRYKYKEPLHVDKPRIAKYLEKEIRKAEIEARRADERKARHEELSRIRKAEYRAYQEHLNFNLSIGNETMAWANSLTDDICEVLCLWSIRMNRWHSRLDELMAQSGMERLEAKGLVTHPPGLPLNWILSEHIK
jgi:hypothetical protein